MVVDALRKRFRVPVWLVGTSRGTLSAAATGLQLGKATDGVVLTSTMAYHGFNGIEAEVVAAIAKWILRP